MQPDDQNIGEYIMDYASIIEDYDELNTILESEHEGKKIVCTIGSWDLLHRGHIEYIKKAKNLGDILVVGVDSDETYKKYKGNPVFIPQDDRLKIISSIKFIDYVTLITDVEDNGEWKMDLVKTINPDIFLANPKSFSSDQLTKLGELCELKIVNFFSPDAPSVLITHQFKTIKITSNEQDLWMRKWSFRILVLFLSLSILTTLMLIGFTAYKGTNLSENTLNLLIIKTIPEIFGMMFIVVKYLFPNNQTEF